MSNWKSFRINDLFDVVIGKQPPKKERITDYSKKLVPAITGVTVDNGIVFWVKKENRITYKNILTISKDGEYAGSVFLQSQEIYLAGHSMGLIPKIKLSNRHLLYISSLFTYYLKIGYWKINAQIPSVTLEKLDKITIQLPIKQTGEPDWQFMEEFIKELEAERIQELEAYLIATSLNDYHLTDGEYTLLDYKPKFKSFKLASTYVMRGKLIEVDERGLFDIVPTKKKINANSITFDGQFPYVARGESKNGIRGYINFDKQYLNPKDTISFGQDTATMYYQPNAYFTGDKIQVFKLNEAYGTLTENIALYIISSMKKSFANFVWGQQSFALDVISEIPVELPVDVHGNIDFEYMSQYIQAIKKVSIEDVVRYKDKIIIATQNIVNE